MLCYSNGTDKNTGAVITAKPVTEPVVYKLLANCQTRFGYKFRPMRTAGMQSEHAGTTFSPVHTDPESHNAQRHR